MRKYLVKNVQNISYRKGGFYKIAKYTPSFLLQPLLYIIGYASQNLLISWNWLGIEKRQFGSAIIINPGKNGF